MFEVSPHARQQLIEFKAARAIEEKKKQDRLNSPEGQFALLTQNATNFISDKTDQKLFGEQLSYSQWGKLREGEDNSIVQAQCVMISDARMLAGIRLRLKDNSSAVTSSPEMVLEIIDAWRPTARIVAGDREITYDDTDNGAWAQLKDFLSQLNEVSFDDNLGATEALNGLLTPIGYSDEPDMDRPV